MTTKIPTIQEMETKLLQDSVTSDINIPQDVQEHPQKILTADDVRRDISVMARTFIKVYCGWPFYDEILKRKILQFLLSVYDNAHDVTADDFCNEMSKLIAILPDKHIALRFLGHEFHTGIAPVRKNVGKNIAERKEKYCVEMRDGVAIIALPTLFGWTKQDREDFQKQYLLIPSLQDGLMLII